ncbi:hypothetical protein, partial [Pseudomonas sp. CK-NBRI-02]|uniref:hypothetical protein n=1 Tax=Pseudomonas sp. CK-NBRI-02 TaxID=2249759 RepID=UPI001C497D7A
TRCEAPGRMQGRAAFGYFWPRPKVTRRKGGKVNQRRQIKRISPQTSKPTTNNQQPTTNNQQPTTNNQQPT